MNRDKEDVMERTESGGMLSPSRPSHMQNKNRPWMRLVGVGIIFVGGVIILLSLLLLILPLFRVGSIKVVGNKHYTEEQIIATSGIELGTDVLAVDVKGAANALLDHSPYIQSCKISVLPFSVVIEVEEKKHVMYTEHENGFVSFEYREDGTILVLNVSQSTEGMEGFPAATMPQISYATPGVRMAFTQQNLDITYMKKVIDSLEWYQIYDSVTAIDFSSRVNLSFELNGQCRVKLGTAEDLDDKIAEALNQISNNLNVIEVDVSDLTKTSIKTY